MHFLDPIAAAIVAFRKAGLTVHMIDAQVLGGAGSIVSVQCPSGPLTNAPSFLSLWSDRLTSAAARGPSQVAAESRSGTGTQR